MEVTERRKGTVALPGLRAARLRLGWTQAALTEESGVERATLSNLENGNRAARPLTALKLAKALGVGVEELTAAPKDQPTLFPSSPEERGVVYAKGIWRLLDLMDRRLWEAIESGAVDATMAEWAAKVERDAWERVVPEMRLMQGTTAMTKAEKDAHELVYATLLGFGGTVQEAYNAAVKNLTEGKAEVVGFDRLRAAMEERERAQEEGRRRVEEARSA